MNRFAAVCGVAALVSCSGDNRNPTSISSRADVLRQIDDDIPLALPYFAIGSIVPTAYRLLFAYELRSIDAQSDDDLAVMYGAAERAAFYSLADEDVNDMKAVLEKLETDGHATKDDYVRMYRKLVAVRKFQDANRLIRKHSVDVQEIPEVIDSASGAAVTQMILDPNTHRLVRRPAKIVAPAGIVVVAHPRCHFTQDAVLAIERDPVLADAFTHHAIWIAPQESPFDWNEFASWNTEHPNEPMSLAFKRDEWPAILWWSTPDFYFFKDGQLVSVVRGWPRGGRKVELAAALKQIGLTN